MTIFMANLKFPIVKLRRITAVLPTMHDWSTQYLFQTKTIRSEQAASKLHDGGIQLTYYHCYKKCKAT